MLLFERFGILLWILTQSNMCRSMDYNSPPSVPLAMIIGRNHSTPLTFLSHIRVSRGGSQVFLEVNEEEEEERLETSVGFDTDLQHHDPKNHTETAYTPSHQPQPVDQLPIIDWIIKRDGQVERFDRLKVLYCFLLFM